MAVFRLTTGTVPRRPAMAYRGGSFFDKREFAMTAVLVKHPAGDLLIDTGFSRHPAARVCDRASFPRASPGAGSRRAELCRHTYALT
jgi:hypothetical protein